MLARVASVIVNIDQNTVSRLLSHYHLDCNVASQRMFGIWSIPEGIVPKFYLFEKSATSFISNPGGLFSETTFQRRAVYFYIITRRSQIAMMNQVSSREARCLKVLLKYALILGNR